MPYHIEDAAPSQNGFSTRVKMEGEITIESAAELKNILMTALDQNADIVVDCSGVSLFDLSALQLLCAAHRTAVALKKKLTLSGVDEGIVKSAIDEAGFQRQRACLLSPDKENCLWVGQISA